MRLESGYCSRLASLAHHVNSLKEGVSECGNGIVDYANAYLAYTNGDRNAVEFFVESYQEARIHGGCQEVEHPVVFIQND
jgi:hypothetical protein